MIVVLNIVLLEPEMPANTGNIGRTCCATGTRLHLIEPMGFRINDKMLKRAGLDYWEHLDVTIYDSYEDFLEKNPKARDKMYMATTKARHRYTDVSYEEDAYIMFGKESAGIPEEILVQTPDTADLPENHAHHQIQDELMQECEDIKRQLPISSFLRPAWDLETLSRIGVEEFSFDLGISKRIYTEKDEFYNPTPMFLIFAKKQR